MPGIDSSNIYCNRDDAESLNLNRVFRGRGVIPDAKIGEVIAYVLVASILFVDLENSSVLNVVGRENVRFFALQEKGGV